MYLKTKQFTDVFINRLSRLVVDRLDHRNSDPSSAITSDLFIKKKYIILKKLNLC